MPVTNPTKANAKEQETDRKKLETARDLLVQSFEERRKALIDRVSMRALSKEAGLEASYYQHFVAGDFQFPTQPRCDALNKALNRLEEVERFRTELRKGGNA